MFNLYDEIMRVYDFASVIKWTKLNEDIVFESGKKQRAEYSLNQTFSNGKGQPGRVQNSNTYEWCSNVQNLSINRFSRLEISIQLGIKTVVNISIQDFTLEIVSQSSIPEDIDLVNNIKILYQEQYLVSKEDQLEQLQGLIYQSEFNQQSFELEELNQNVDYVTQQKIIFNHLQKTNQNQKKNLKQRLQEELCKNFLENQKEYRIALYECQLIIWDLPTFTNVLNQTTHSTQSTEYSITIDPKRLFQEQNQEYKEIQEVEFNQDNFLIITQEQYQSKTTQDNQYFD